MSRPSTGTEGPRELERRRLELMRSGVAERKRQGRVVQGNVPPSLRWNRVHASLVLRVYGALTREAVAASAAPDLVVWPESALQTELADPIYGPPLRALVERVGVPLLTGIPRSEVDRHYNSALFLARAWQNLMPDENHAVVTAGYGTYGGTNYATAGRTADGRLALHPFGRRDRR